MLLNARWTPSVSVVAKQVILTKVNDNEVNRFELPVTDSVFSFGVNPGDVVSVELFAVTALGLESAHVTASTVVDSVPEPPTGLTLDVTLE